MSKDSIARILNSLKIKTKLHFITALKEFMIQDVIYAWSGYVPTKINWIEKTLQLDGRGIRCVGDEYGGWVAGVKQNHRTVGEGKMMMMMMIRWCLRGDAVQCTRGGGYDWWDVWGYDTFRYLMGLFLVGTFSLSEFFFATCPIVLFHRLSQLS